MMSSTIVLKLTVPEFRKIVRVLDKVNLSMTPIESMIEFVDPIIDKPIKRFVR
jgi:hypothetical protein